MGGMFPEAGPTWIWGQGTPAAIDPFTVVQKGSLYSEVNADDDDPSLWMKVDEGGDAADWVRWSNTGVVEVRSALYTIDAADSEQVIFHAVSACQILSAGILYNEATETSGAASGDITVGTAAAGDELVTATAYEVSKATGYYKALTVKLSGLLAAGASVFVSHDDAGASVPGTVFVVMKIRVEV
jgi:hypothetical protein